MLHHLLRKRFLLRVVHLIHADNALGAYGYEVQVDHTSLFGVKLRLNHGSLFAPPIPAGESCITSAVNA